MQPPLSWPRAGLLGLTLAIAACGGEPAQPGEQANNTNSQNASSGPYTRLTEEAAWSTPSPVLALAAHDGRVITGADSCADACVSVWDVRADPPAVLGEVGDTTLDEQVLSIRVVSGGLIVGTNYRARYLDRTADDQLSLVDDVDLGGEVTDLAVKDGALLAAARNFGIHEVSVDPSRREVFQHTDQVSTDNPNPDLVSLAIHGDALYTVARAYDELIRLSLEPSRRLVTTARADAPALGNRATKLRVSRDGTRVLVAAGARGLLVFDASLKPVSAWSDEPVRDLVTLATGQVAVATDTGVRVLDTGTTPPTVAATFTVKGGAAVLALDEARDPARLVVRSRDDARSLRVLTLSR